MLAAARECTILRRLLAPLWCNRCTMIARFCSVCIPMAAGRDYATAMAIALMSVSMRVSHYQSVNVFIAMHLGNAKQPFRQHYGRASGLIAIPIAMHDHGGLHQSERVSQSRNEAPEGSNTR